jgi:hypothetical protein
MPRRTVSWVERRLAACHSSFCCATELVGAGMVTGPASRADEHALKANAITTSACGLGHKRAATGAALASSPAGIGHTQTAECGVGKRASWIRKHELVAHRARARFVARHRDRADVVEAIGGSRYRLRNSPFFAFGVSVEDIVHAEERDGALFFRKRLCDREQWRARSPCVAIRGADKVSPET